MTLNKQLEKILKDKGTDASGKWISVYVDDLKSLIKETAEEVIGVEYIKDQNPLIEEWTLDEISARISLRQAQEKKLTKLLKDSL